MPTEIEAKFLNVDHGVIREKLKKIGANCTNPSRLMRRKNFDFADRRLEKESTGWVRVRDEGDKVTVAYKQLNDRTLHGTKEISFTAGDFDTACSFLESIGLVQQSYQETKRESWILEDIEIELDEWPWIPTFIEVEAPSEIKLKEFIGSLGMKLEDAVHGSVEVAYQALYDVTDEEVDHWSEILFTPVPEWLVARKK